MFKKCIVTLHIPDIRRGKHAIECRGKSLLVENIFRPMFLLIRCQVAGYVLPSELLNSVDQLFVHMILAMKPIVEKFIDRSFPTPLWQIALQLLSQVGFTYHEIT